MGKLWGAMRELQMVTYPSLIMIPYPANALFFYKILITFANIDILGGFMENDVFSLLALVETTAFNQKFENYDYGAQMHLLLSGSYFAWIAFVVLWNLSKYLINKVCVVFHNHTAARQMGA